MPRTNSWSLRLVIRNANTVLHCDRRLLSGFGVVRIGRCDQAGDEGAEERLPAAPGVVDELEEAEIGGQLLLRDAPVGPEPGAQQRPEALGRVDVHLAEAVAVLVAGVLAPRAWHTVLCP